ncbi:MAG TPA: hypothetical protein DC057_05830, partial [Spirochaetia bacterium]|nr:hypothetical protein [Spirochaetia bacterium]
TTGGIEFNMLKGKRTTLRKKREKGSVVYVVVNMTKDEFNECRDYCLDILVPQNIKINVNAEDYKVKLPYRNPYKTFITKLPTEIKENDKMKIVTRETEVHIHKGLLGPYVYEMGIPVCEIDCDYSIDVQQKVPLSNDRDKIDTKYLKTLYGEVLNKMINEIMPTTVSPILRKMIISGYSFNFISIGIYNNQVNEIKLANKAIILLCLSNSLVYDNATSS